MKKLSKVNDYLSLSFYILIGLDVFNRTKSNINSLVIFMGLLLIVILNNYLRIKYFYKDRNKYFTSMFLYMIMSGILNYNINGYVDIFQFMILYELILFTAGNLSRIFIGLEILSMLFLKIFRKLSLAEVLSLQFWQESFLDIVMVVMFILFYLLSLFSYRALRMEKRKVDELNKELNLSYDKLIEQSKKIEELTIAKERNRVAREIHDNLGHSLIALNMNLDVAENIMDKDLDKSRKLINKSRKLAKESMEILREAVYALKESNPRILKDSIEDMIDNIESAERINIVFNMDEGLEELPYKYNNTIYSTVKESLTNSIKHGKANKISIDIKLDENKINLNIRDNGLGCSKLVKGNGLFGIENRVTKLNGDIEYNSNANEGFQIGVKLWL